MRSRKPNPAERAEHIKTLMRLGRLVVAAPLTVAPNRTFVLLTTTA